MPPRWVNMPVGFKSVFDRKIAALNQEIGLWYCETLESYQVQFLVARGGRPPNVTGELLSRWGIRALLFLFAWDLKIFLALWHEANNPKGPGVGRGCLN